MRSTIRIRGTGGAAEALTRSLQRRGISEDIFEVDVEATDPRAKALFDKDAQREWLITFWEIRREYLQYELEAASAFHLNVRRVFTEVVSGEWSHYEFEPRCRPCLVPTKQVGLVRLASPLKCSDDIVRLPDGPWLCKPDFIRRLRMSGLETPSITPVFSSRQKMKKWCDARPNASSSLRSADDPLSPFYLSQGEEDVTAWVQMHPKVGPLKIVDPTDFRESPFAPPTKVSYREELIFRNNLPVGSIQKVCPCDLVAGPNVVSELFLQAMAPLDGDWFQTIEYIGTDFGTYLPTRELIVSTRCYEFLKGCRLHNIDLDRVHIC